jgi:arginine repressor
VAFAKTYGGTGNDRASYVLQTSDGGYIVVGDTGSLGADSVDIFLVKTDANGNIIWAKTYGGIVDEYAHSVLQTSDGGYIVAGETHSFGAGWHDVLLIKTDANGNVIWAKTYGGTSWDVARSVQQTSDGGYIVAGYTDSFGAGGPDFFLIKIDANGNISWAKTYGGTYSDWARSVQQTSDGGYIVAGFTGSFGAGGVDIFLVKTNARGNIGSCSIVQDAKPIVNNAPFAVTSESPDVSSPSFTVNSVSPTVTSPNLTVSAPCP